MHKDSQKHGYCHSNPKGLTKTASEQFVQKVIWGIDLQILQNTPFYCQCPEEHYQKCHQKHPTNKIYHISKLGLNADENEPSPMWTSMLARSFTGLKLGFTTTNLSE